MDFTQKGFQDLKPKTERKLFLYGPDSTGEWEPLGEYIQEIEDMVRDSKYSNPYRIMEVTTTTEYRIIKEQK